MPCPGIVDKANESTGMEISHVEKRTASGKKM
jgi:hypothetical protein